MAQALPLDEQPVLEGGVAQANAVEEITAIERRRLLQRLRLAVIEQPLEAADIDRQAGRIEAHRLAVGNDRRRGHRLQALAEPCQAMLKTVAGLLIAALAP